MRNLFQVNEGSRTFSVSVRGNQFVLPSYPSLLALVNPIPVAVPKVYLTSPFFVVVDDAHVTNNNGLERWHEFPSVHEWYVSMTRIAFFTSTLNRSCLFYDGSVYRISRPLPTW